MPSHEPTARDADVRTRSAPSTRRVAAVVNPVHAASRAALADLRACCARLGLEAPDVYETTIESPGLEQARAAIAAGADVVVAVGGDGTVREVAHALAGGDVPLGIVPTGTANLYARNAGLHGLHRDLLALLAIAGAPEPADLGVVALTTTCPDPPLSASPALGPPSNDPDRDRVHERIFLVVVGIGHDADTVADVQHHDKRRHGWVSYVLPGLRRLGDPPIDVHVDLDGRAPVSARAWSVLLANTGRLPAGVRVVPDARPNDGALHVTVVAPSGAGQLARIAAAGVRPRYRAPDGLTYRRGTRATVEAAEPRRVQIDGDVVEGVTRLEARIEPGALLVHTLPSRQAAPRVDDLSDAAVARLVYEGHDGGISRDGGVAMVRLLTGLTGERFVRVKYLLNSLGDGHDLEQFVYGDLGEAPRAALLTHIAEQARALGTTRDVRVLCDIDDTLKCAIHDDRYPRGTIYPGIEAFLHALDEGLAGDPSRPGDLTFVTARPGGPLGLLERYTRGALDDLDLPAHTIMGGSLLNLHTRTAIAQRKIENIDRDRRLFPECRMVFCGHTGQADAFVGLRARRDYGDHVAAVFVHDVVGIDARTRADWAHEGVYAVDTWDEAARIARDLDLIGPQGLRSVERAVAAGITPRARRRRR